MKKKRIIILAIIIMVIGFATVTTSLYINSNATIATTNFDVYFSGALLDDVDMSNELITDKKTITFTSKELKKIDDNTTLEYEITNGSNQYDANVSISCVASNDKDNNLNISYDKTNFDIIAGEYGTGKIRVELDKSAVKEKNISIACTLNVKAVERTTRGEDVVNSKDYSISGYFLNEDKETVAGAKLVVYSDTPHYVETDMYGYFYVDGLERGIHQIYYVNNIDDPKTMTKEEIIENASASVETATNHKNDIVFSNKYVIKDSLITNQNENKTYKVNLDVKGGNELQEKEIEVTQNSKYEKLPTPEKVGYNFVGWYLNDKLITNDVIVTEDKTHTLVAKWSQGEYLVTLNPDGGSVTPKSVRISYDSSYGTLPTPERLGYTFDGWYDGDVKITSESIYKTAGNKTLTAKWIENNFNVVANGYEGVYDNENHSISVIPDITDTRITYSLDNENFSETNPTFKNVGEYTVYYKVEKYNYLDVTGSAKIKITKAEGTMTAPTAKTITYNGTEQELINAGESNTGTMYYKIGDEAYSTSIPKAINAGTYRISYYSKGDKNHLDTTENTINVTINKASNTLELSTNKIDLVYPETTTFTVSKNVSGGELSISSNSKDKATASISNQTATVKSGTTAGSATITVTSKETENYKTATATVNVTVTAGTIPVEASGVSTTYNGNNHSISVTTTLSGATISYSTDGQNYTNTNPTYKNAGTYTVYYKVEKAGYTTVSSSKQVKINKANNTLTLSATSGTITYPETTTFTVSENTSGGTLTVSSSNNGVATTSINDKTVTVNSGTTASTATITVTSAETTNYNAETATYKITVAHGTLPVTATGKTTTYNGNNHSISVSSTVSGAKITYSTDGNTYTDTNPTYKNAGTYTVYYKVVASGYKNATGSQTVKINKADNTLTLSATSGTLIYPETKTFTVSKNTSGGTLTVASSNNGIATASINDKTVTVNSGTTASTATITVTSAETTNYKKATATYSVTIKPGTLAYTATGYSATYNGKAHGISITGVTTGATVKYGTTNGTYDKTSSPTRTDAGTTTVYYQITKAGYTTVTGSKTISIAKAAGNVTLNKTTLSLVYPNTGTVAVTNNTSGGTLTAASTNNGVATASVKNSTVTINSGVTASTATITITSGETTNYNAASATVSVTVTPGTISSTASNYIGTYDGTAKSATVTTTTPGAIIKYGTTNGTYNLTSMPTYTNIGIYTIYYQITKAGYTTKTGSVTITINGIYTIVTDENSNKKADIGDEIVIGEEHFYVISNENGVINALAKYNLMVGDEMIASPWSVTPLTNPTGIQDSRATMSSINGSEKYTGILQFSNSTGWEPGTTIDIKQYEGRVKEALYGEKGYENYIQKTIPSASVRLITKEELEILVNDGATLSIGDNIKEKSDAKGYTWLYSTLYWTQSSFSGDGSRIFAMRNSLVQNPPNYWSSGVRPVVTIP